MNCLPLIERELQLGLRRRYGTYKARTFGAITVVAAAFWVLFVWSAWHPTANSGRAFLHLLAGLGYFSALLTGVLLTADSISRERRDGTLDLLLLTDLRIGDVVVGKLLASMVLPLCGFIATIPVLQFSVMLGGTTVGQCTRLLLVWSNALFFSLAASTLVSSLCREQRIAQTGAFLLVAIAAEAVPFYGSALSSSMADPFWKTISLLLSPGGPYELTSTYPSARGLFWSALIGNQVLAWTFLGLARVALARNLAADSEAVCPTSTSLVRDRPGEGFSGPKSSRQQHLLESSPIQWLAARNRGTPVLVWVLALTGMAVVLNYGADPFGNGQSLFGFAILVMVHLVFKLAIGSSATHAFAADRRTGALESLLATPVDVGEVASGMFHNFQRRFAGPVLLLACASAWAALRLSNAGQGQSAVVLTLATILLPIDCYCLLWTGLFQGLAARAPALALGTALFEIVLLPWAWFFIGSRFFWNSTFSELLILAAIIVPVNQWWFVSNAKTNFLRHFRTLALKPFAEKNPIIQSEWSPINWEEESPRRPDQAGG